MQVTWFHQALSLLGAALILIAYTGHQMHRMDARAPLYSLFNAVGAAILAYIAFRPFQAGFAVMESVWTVVSFGALIKALRARRNSADEADAGQHP
jgi:hypothetical protein